MTHFLTPVYEKAFLEQKALYDNYKESSRTIIAEPSATPNIDDSEVAENMTIDEPDSASASITTQNFE